MQVYNLMIEDNFFFGEKENGMMMYEGLRFMRNEERRKKKTGQANFNGVCANNDVVLCGQNG